MERESCWKRYTPEQIAQLDELCEDYRQFISKNKTEREFTTAAIEMARAYGYSSLDEAIAQRMPVNPGDKLYAVNHGKALMLMHVGSKPMSEGFNVLGAHMDSPRMDLKQNPLYEKSDLAYFDTHYYGGIKTYQWVTIPLALHGVVCKKDGSTVQVCIGEDPTDPVVCVSDLLIHLAGKQMEKTAKDVIDPEDLDILVGNRPLVVAEGEEAPKSPVKQYLLNLLSERYGIEEEDFLSAEIVAVPAGEARDLGLDRSMILGYGQDDSVCAYTSLVAQMEVENPEKTAVCILVDKEEIGSVGATGMESMFFENTLAELMALAGFEGNLPLRRALAASAMLSSDVNAGYDPSYPSFFEERSSGFCGRGLVFNKFTGARGKSGSNDANAEYVARVRKVMDDAGVQFQFAELGRVGVGGGGTIAFIPAKYGMSVIDSGVSVLSMHAPWEVTSKADIYEAYRGYLAFQMNM